VSPELEAIWGPACGEAAYSLDSPFPPCILPKQNQGRDQE
jgi:hypothetical protein